MSTIRQILTTALSAVLPNSWAVELPPNPTWPAIVFDIETRPEPGFCAAVGYDQHTANIIYLARTAEELEALEPQIRTAIQALPQLLTEDDSGDADYEPDPAVYARYITFVLRTRTTAGTP